MTTETDRGVRQDTAAWQAGYQAGLEGCGPARPPAGVDRLAWASGYLEGRAERTRRRIDEKKIELHKRQRLPSR